MSVPKLDSNAEALVELARNVCLMYMNRSGNDYVQSEGNDFINNVAFAMHFRPDDTKLEEGKSGDVVFFSQKVLDGIKHVIDAIKDYGGNAPHMVIYPLVLYIQKTNELFNNVVTLPLFKVRNKHNEKEFKFIDIVGRSYIDEDDFVGGAQFPPCNMIYPKNLKFMEAKDHFPLLGDAMIKPSIMKYVDITVSVLCLGAGALTLFFGIGAPALALCAGYGIARAGVILEDRAVHGQTINPGKDWDAFNAWAAIFVNAVGFGFGVGATKLSGTMARMAQEGKAISRTMKWGRRALIAVPMFLNAALVGTQAYQLVTFWDNISVTDRIIIILQFIFFAAATAKIVSISLKDFQTRVVEVVYEQLVSKLQTDTVKASLNTAIARVGGLSYEAINFFKKLANYNNGELINISTNSSSAQYLQLTKNGPEIMFKMGERYFACPEAVMDINDSIETEELEPQPSTSTSQPQETYDESRLRIVSELAQKRRFISEESISSGQEWLKNALNVDELENYTAKNINIFKNMKYFDQIRTKVFEEIGMGLNEGLIKACFRYAEESIPEGAEERTVGQFASDFEVAALLIQKEVKSFCEKVKGMPDNEIETQYGVEMTSTYTETLSYADLPNIKGSTQFAAEMNAKVKAKEYNRVVNDIGTPNAKEIYETWENSFIRNDKFINYPEEDVHALANQIIEAGEICYPNATNQAINAARLLTIYPRETIETFGTEIASIANKTIQSCKNDVKSRVFEVTKPNEKLPIRRLLFWNLDDGDYAKNTMVNLNTKTNKVTIQNVSLIKKAIKQTSVKTHRNAIMDHWNTKFDYDFYKAKFDEIVSSMWDKCKDFVGPSVIRPGENHTPTVWDIQNLDKLRFRTIEQAICHVIKHGENVSTEDLPTAIEAYCNKAKEIIESTNHSETKKNVSSSWTQTGSARDFVFYRQSEGQTSVDKAVVLVREGGETILKTWFTDENLRSIPEQTMHSVREPLDLRHVSMTTFYYQLMLVAPHYGVVLPNEFDLYASDMDTTKTRAILIMAGHFLGKDDIPDVTGLAKALNQAFPTDGEFWNVLIPKDPNYSFNVVAFNDNYMYFRIASCRFVVFQAPVPNLCMEQGAIVPCGDLNKRKRRSIEQNHGFNDSETLNAAVQLLSRTNKATEITRRLKELFGDYWHCIRAPKFHYCIYYHNAFLKMTLDDGYMTCVIFR